MMAMKNKTAVSKIHKHDLQAITITFYSVHVYALHDYDVFWFNTSSYVYCSARFCRILHTMYNNGSAAFQYANCLVWLSLC